MTNIKCFTVAGVALLLVSVGATATGTDSVSVLQRAIDRQASVKDFFRLPFANPALKPFQYAGKLTEVRLEAQHERETEAVAVQQGDGQRFYLVDVDACIPLANTTLWGNASYRNGERFNVKLNETSDPELLYPYLAGDTIGGDLQSEIYSFAGGYARHDARFSWGIYAAFRAMQEYRAVDPRPGNIASDLCFSLGGSARIFPSHAVAAALHLRKYKQKNEIAFYNELGDVKLYHYTGLGMDYVRFRTKADKLNYNGSAVGASINLFPFRRAGVIAGLKYNRFTFEKVIASLNELNLIDLTEQSMEWEAGYRQTTPTHAVAFRIDGQLRRRAGRENIFGDESSNNYPFIVSLEQYRRTTARLQAVALYERYAGGSQWAVQPSAGYESDEEKYTLPQRKIRWAHLTPSFRLAFAKRWEKISFHAAADVKHYIPMSSTADLSGATSRENFSIPSLLRNYEYLSGRRTVASLDGRVNYVFRQPYAFFLALHWQRGQYVDHTTGNYIAASGGICF
jgi:hypothetical protein